MKRKTAILIDVVLLVGWIVGFLFSQLFPYAFFPFLVFVLTLIGFIGFSIYIIRNFEYFETKKTKEAEKKRKEAVNDFKKANEHMLKHYGNDPAVCENCAKQGLYSKGALESKEYLDKYQKAGHTFFVYQMNYVCEECGSRWLIEKEVEKN